MALRELLRTAAIHRQHAKSSDLSLLLTLLLLAEILPVIIWVGAMQAGGMLYMSLDGRLTISYGERLWPLGVVTAVSVAGALLAAASDKGDRIPAWMAFSAGHRRAVVGGLIAAGFAGTLLVVWTLRAFPNSSDEYDYLWQAETFAAGRVWNPAPAVPALFEFFSQTIADGKWISQYPPGWSLLIAPALVLGLPGWLVSPVFGVALLLVVWRLACRSAGELGGGLALALLVFSSFFLFNAASYFNALPATLAGLLFCWAALEYLDQPGARIAVVAGVALGVVGLIRPFDVLIFALPFAVSFAWRARRQHYRLLPLIVLGGLPFLALLCAYDLVALSTLSPTGDLTAVSTKFGLYPVNQGMQLTPADELHFVIVRLIMLAEWGSPLLILGYVVAFSYLGAQRQLTFMDFVFPLNVLLYMVVPFEGGDQYGPRYYFAGYPFVILTTVTAFAPVLRASSPRRMAFVGSLVFVHWITCISGAAIFGMFLRLVINQRMDVYDQVREAKLSDAVVVLRSSAGLLRETLQRDLTRNGITIAGPVIYVLDIPDKLAELRQLMPTHRFYVYTRSPMSPRGALEPL